jgi:hypothetical protein
MAATVQNAIAVVCLWRGPAGRPVQAKPARPAVTEKLSSRPEARSVIAGRSSCFLPDCSGPLLSMQFAASKRSVINLACNAAGAPSTELRTRLT